MENTATQPKTLIIEAKKSDGSQNASIKLPLGLLNFAAKVLNLLPANIKSSINKELKAKGVEATFEDLVSEGHETLINTLREVQIDVQDQKQKFKLSVV